MSKPNQKKPAEPSSTTPEILHKMLKNDVWYIDSSNPVFDLIYIREIQIKAAKNTYQLVEAL
jgi:hypothetical protein